VSSGSLKAKMRKEAAKEIIAAIRDLMAAEGDKCGPKGCIRKHKDGWKIMSGKTGKFWPQTYDSKEEAEEVLKRYHGWGF
jgi:hypothetical protein